MYLYLPQAETDGSLWAMDRQTFRKIVLKSAFQKRKMYESFLENVRLLECLEVKIDFCRLSMCLNKKVGFYHLNILLEAHFLVKTLYVLALWHVN